MPVTNNLPVSGKVLGVQTLLLALPGVESGSAGGDGVIPLLFQISDNLIDVTLGDGGFIKNRMITF